jgi:hypothetical protein
MQLAIIGLLIVNVVALTINVRILKDAIKILKQSKLK